MNKTDGLQALSLILKANVMPDAQQICAAHDMGVLCNPEERYYVWALNKTGTYLIPKSSVPVLREIVCRDNLYDLMYYEIDTDTMQPAWIDDIVQYMEYLNNTNTLQDEVTQHFAEDEYDYEY